MSAFKKLKSTDAFVTTYVAKKSWNITGSALGDHGVQGLSLITSSGNIYPNSSDDYGPTETGISNQGTYNKKITYRAIKQLYYSNYNNTNGSILEPNLYNSATGSTSTTSNEFTSSKFFENFEQSSFRDFEGIQPSGSRYLNNVGFVFSIPTDIIGTHIEPSSFKLTPSSSINPYDRNGGRPPIIDNGEGILMLSESAQYTNVGNIIYTHGVIILTDNLIASRFTDNPRLNKLEFKSNQPIYTYNYHCKVSDYEYNHTLNPSALSGSDNKLKDNVSGSSFNPYITSIGLYNDAQELIAVGKLSQPLQKPSTTELSIQVKLDI